MTSVHDRAALTQALALLADAGVVPQAAASLQRGMRAAGDALRKTVIDEIPAFSISANPQILPEVEQHAGEHLAEIARLLGGGKVGDFEFVREHAQRRAEQRFPLEATLHAYRCGHQVLSRWCDRSIPWKWKTRRARNASSNRWLKPWPRCPFERFSGFAMAW